MVERNGNKVVVTERAIRERVVRQLKKNGCRLVARGEVAIVRGANVVDRFDSIEACARKLNLVEAWEAVEK